MPKQWKPLGGRTVILWAFDAVARAGCDPIVVVVPNDYEAAAIDVFGLDEETTYVQTIGLAEPPDVRLCFGGPTRQDSIHNGLALVDTPAVVVVDASRPLVTPELVQRVVSALDRSGAVIAAVPMDETLKRGQDGLVVETIDRSSVWKAQTPAAFRTELLKDAHRQAAEERFVGTDEAQLIERYGGSVALVPGSRDNLKLTWVEDFELAEAILSVRRS